MHFIVLAFYLAALFFLGKIIVKRLLDGYPLILETVGAFLLGTLVGVPITYVLSCALKTTGEPILWATVATTIGIFLIRFRFSSKDKKRKLSVLDLATVAFSLVFSSWLMTKTFHGDNTGQLFVGSNNIFDFGMAIGLVRSMSWGDNIPFMSPFFSGFPMLYHYFFVFWVSLWAYFGVPIVWAVNIPSILSFSSLVMVIYYLPQVIAKQKPFVGWLAVLLAITNSSLTFWRMLLERGFSLTFLREIWQLPTYPFAGPFDGSTISIFVTLNNYVNQRHLAFSIATGLFLFLIVISRLSKNKWHIWQSVFVGVLTGMLLGWNMVVYVFVTAVISGTLIFRREWKSFFVYVCISGLVGFLFLVPIVGFVYNAILLLKRLTVGTGGAPAPTWNAIEYFWHNLGVLPFIAGVGLFVLPKKIRSIFSPLVIFFLLACFFAVMSKKGFEQKSYSFSIIGMNVLAAIALGWLWQGKKLLTKASTVVVIFVLSISGIVDLFPVKNEFAFPLIHRDMVPLISWMNRETPKNAIFVSYQDMIDPVVLAGRKNYYGFFKNIGYQNDRSEVVKQIYAGNITMAREIGISYILVPKWEKNDFPYVVQLSDAPVVFEDARFRVHRVE